MNITRQNTSRWLARFSISCLIAIAAAFGSAAAQSNSAKHVTPKQQAARQTTASQTTQSPGERKFQENCSRCHTAPEQLSPRITGTILMHMRVRASLSEQDAQDILRFLSP